jgi:DNA damage-binding protein 1
MDVPADSSTISSSTTFARAIPGSKGKGRAEVQEGAWAVTVVDDLEGSTEVLERWMNLAPVKDFCAVSEEGGGVVSEIPCSGPRSGLNAVTPGRCIWRLEHEFSQGSSQRSWLRRGRAGRWARWRKADLALRTQWVSQHVGRSDRRSDLLLSTSTFTSMLSLNGDIVEIELPPQAASSATLAAEIIASNALVQVTASGVVIWSDIASGVEAGRWSSPSEITAGHIQGELAVVAVRGGQLVVLSLANGVEQIL